MVPRLSAKIGSSHNLAGVMEDMVMSGEEVRLPNEVRNCHVMWAVGSGDRCAISWVWYLEAEGEGKRHSWNRSR